MSPQYDAIVSSPIPDIKLGLRLDGDQLAKIDFLPSTVTTYEPIDSQTCHCVKQLRDYFADPAHIFSIKLKKQGTHFQQRVWLALQSIPAGTTISYGGLARKLGSSARAIGNACRENPVPIIVPCHRVVSVKGVGGFMGKRTGGEINLKRWLLKHEHVREVEHVER